MNRHHRRTRSARLVLAAALWLAAPAVPALSLDWQAHGFAAQGLIYSDGNAVADDSEEGTLDYRELGLTGALAVGSRLSASAQLAVRKFGEVDDEDVILDYGLVDYRFLDGVGAEAGVRAGRVRNPFGLYNDTRDVIFTRPGILLPDSVYSDLSGQQRGFLFSGDGGQAYGRVDVGAHSLSLVATGHLDHRLSGHEEELLLTLNGLPFHVDAEDFWLAQLMDEIDGRRWQLGLSYLHLRLPFATDPGAAVAADGIARVEGYVLSLRRNAGPFSFTAEYAVQETRTFVQIPALGLTQASDGWSDGAYLQAEYHFAPRWTAMGRVEAQASDRNDRDGGECAAGDRHACFARSAVVGVNWRRDEHWGVWAEGHLIDGYFNKFSLNQEQDGATEKHWGLALLVVAYRF